MLINLYKKNSKSVRCTVDVQGQTGHIKWHGTGDRGVIAIPAQVLDEGLQCVRNYLSENVVGGL